MNAPIVAFFNNKGRVGKTSLVYHLAWMFSDLGVRALAADLDPQANLTAAFLDEDRLIQLWPDEGSRRQTIFGCVDPLIQGTGDVLHPKLEPVGLTLALIAGDLRLATFEDELAKGWSECLGGNARAFRVVSAFWRILQSGAHEHEADIVLMDLGPNLGAINRAAFIAADYLVVPLAPDLFSLQGLRNLGPTTRKWTADWSLSLERKPAGLPELPAGNVRTLGYVVQQHAVRLDRPVKAYDKWLSRIPLEYHNSVLCEQPLPDQSIDSDPACLGLLKHYHSLMPMAQEARKPIFHLKVADGAIGAHFQAARDAGKTYKNLALRIAKDVGVQIPN